MFIYGGSGTGLDRIIENPKQANSSDRIAQVSESEFPCCGQSAKSQLDSNLDSRNSWKRHRLLIGVCKCFVVWTKEYECRCSWFSKGSS